VEATTGIASQNQDKLQNVKVYPNPTQNILNLEFSSSEERNVKIEVIDLTGKIIQSSVIDRNIGLIHYDLNSLSSGVYILKIQSANINESVKL
jgi:hypothetical protein